MGWVRVSDDYYDHHKFSGVGPLENALWMAGLAWCNRNLSDGVIPRSTVLRLVDWEGVLDVLLEADPSNDLSNAVTNGVRNSRVAATVSMRLVKAGLWTETETGYEVHDYLVYQRSAHQITEAAKANAARQKRFRDARRGQGSDAESNGVTNGGVTPPPNPNPSSTKRTTSSSRRKPKSAEEQPALDISVADVPDDPEAVNAGHVVAVWVAAYESNELAATTTQRARAGRCARELLNAGNDPFKVLEAARAAGAKGYVTIDTELGSLNGQTWTPPSRQRPAPHHVDKGNPTSVEPPAHDPIAEKLRAKQSKEAVQ